MLLQSAREFVSCLTASAPGCQVARAKTVGDDHCSEGATAELLIGALLDVRELYAPQRSRLLTSTVRSLRQQPSMSEER